MTNHCDHCRTDGDGCPGDTTGIHEDIGQYDWLTGTCPACKERRAIVVWLRGRPSGYYDGFRTASEIERGDHLRGDNAAAALASMTEQRDAARKEAQEAVAGHEKLMEYYVADFSRRMSNNKELRELRKKCSDLSKENEHLSAALNDEKRLDRQEERAAIVAWLREPQDESVTPWCELLADSIENGEHLAGDDE